MNQVIGYFDTTAFNPDFLKRQKIDNLDEIIGTTLQKRFGRFIDSHTIGKDNEDDTIEKMISENIGTLVEFDKEKYIAKIIFKNPIPEDIFKKYYNDKTPIYQ